ncbi:MAG: nitroreductase family protein [Myxococcaceae bacterium]|nr:nitroreductase family protein [Myxococcaceae bacterium]
MSPDDVLVTSPLFFVQPSRGGVVAVDAWHGQRFRALAPEVLDLANVFLQPLRIGDAVDAGHEPVAIAAALEAGLLVPADDEALAGARAWEDHRWSRAAYLLLSQQNLDYTEPTDRRHPHGELVELRRDTIRGYMSEQPYPPLRLVETNAIIELPPPLPAPARPGFDLDALFRRRSVRRYANTPLPLATFATVLHAATRNVRIANESKRGGDLFYLLNSFYSWLRVYVVAQGVDGVERGVYQYDPEAHQLRMVVTGTTDAEILRCIQHQNWIGGGGFTTFFVVQWNRYQWLYRHSRAYVNLLIQLGEIGQELLQQAATHGLGTWPTPAIHESNAAALLHLDAAGEDAMYFVKVGPRVPRS